jgi:hypothetical protein
VTFLCLFLYDTKQPLPLGNQKIGPTVTAKMDEVSTLSFGMQENHAGMQD